MDFNLTDLLTAIAVVAVVALMWLQQRNRDEAPSITVEGIAEGISQANSIWEDAQGYVAAAEQLYLKERIEKDSRFNYVLDRLQETYPDADTDTLKNAIEAGVYFLKRGVERAQQNSQRQ